MASEQNGGISRLVAGLGWFSVGLGLTEMIAPGTLARIIGLPDRGKNRAWTRFYGAREVAAGIGILSQSKPAPWLWARVAGDALDLASLGKTLANDESNRWKAGLATAAVAGVTALDILAAKALNEAAENDGAVVEDVRVVRTIIIDRPPEEVYSYWRNFENLPRFMKHLESVRSIGEHQSHWVIRAPGGKRIEWNAELEHDETNRRIVWRSLPGSDIDHAGWVQFERAPGDRGTLVKVEVNYTPPGGVIGSTLAKLFGQTPGLLIQENLRTLKQLLETGEIAKSDASIHEGMHPAQPEPESVVL
ncbi:MAG TPA: SRPBCC family protein [Bryobacteraceae bacterium]|jgi:uncharacterized membrane protein|nr:SRPBCC family protein [Bryobacteraceae bacterium]